MTDGGKHIKKNLYESSKGNIKLSTSTFDNLNSNLEHSKIDVIKYKPFLFYPTQKVKVYWEMLITVVLLVSIIQTPLDIAFGVTTDEWKSNDIFNLIMDVMFLIDIIINFFSAYEIEEELIEDRKRIA